MFPDTLTLFDKWWYENNNKLNKFKKKKDLSRYLHLFINLKVCLTVVTSTGVWQIWLNLCSFIMFHPHVIFQRERPGLTWLHYDAWPSVKLSWALTKNPLWFSLLCYNIKAQPGIRIPAYPREFPSRFGEESPTMLKKQYTKQIKNYCTFCIS